MIESNNMPTTRVSLPSVPMERHSSVPSNDIDFWENPSPVYSFTDMHRNVDIELLPKEEGLEEWEEKSLHKHMGLNVALLAGSMAALFLLMILLALLMLFNKSKHDEALEHSWPQKKPKGEKSAMVEEEVVVDLERGAVDDNNNDEQTNRPTKEWYV